MVVPLHSRNLRSDERDTGPLRGGPDANTLRFKVDHTRRRQERAARVHSLSSRERNQVAELNQQLLMLPHLLRALAPLDDAEARPPELAVLCRPFDVMANRFRPTLQGLEAPSMHPPLRPAVDDVVCGLQNLIENGHHQVQTALQPAVLLAQVLGPFSLRPDLIEELCLELCQQPAGIVCETLAVPPSLPLLCPWTPRDAGLH
mmetsp:Transcript_17785/g.43516  ORF Transcript_17785/g.43516 Transcript_17785/m.43516 type:complete len:203 (+) Transcript_17785:2863-3471(+)